MNANKFLPALTMVLALSCAPDKTSIEVLGTYAPKFDDNCGMSISTTAQQYAGSMNVGLGESFFLILSLKNNLDSGVSSSGPTPVGQPNRNDYFLSELEIEYTCVDTAQRCASFPRLPPMVQKISGVIPAGGKSELVVELVWTDFAEKVAEKISTDAIETTASIKVRGSFAHGPGFEMHPYIYPMTFRSQVPSDVTCEAGEEKKTFVLSKCPLIAGQDSFVACVPKSTAP